MQRGDASEEVTKERMKGSKKTAGVKSSKRLEKQKPQTKVFLLHFYDLGKGRVEDARTSFLGSTKGIKRKDANSY